MVINAGEFCGKEERRRLTSNDAKMYQGGGNSQSRVFADDKVGRCYLEQVGQRFLYMERNERAWGVTFGYSIRINEMHSTNIFQHVHGHLSSSIKHMSYT